MPEPGMGANNDHTSSSSSAGGFGGGGDNNNNDHSSSSRSSSNNTTADNISSSNTTADNLSRDTSDNNSPTTAESLANSPTTADTLSNTPTHSYDEVPSVAISIDPPSTPSTTNDDNNQSESRSQVPAGVPNEHAGLFGGTPNPVGGVDAVWSNGDGTYSSSDGTTYDPRTGEGTYDPGEDSFAITRSGTAYSVNGDISFQNGVNVDAEEVPVTYRERHPDRVRTSESLALVQHDPEKRAAHYGNRVAFDYYNNANMDSIRDARLMQAANAANRDISGRYPTENMVYFGGMPLTGHLARSIRVSPTSRFNPANRTNEQMLDLARDPAHGGKISPKSVREREVGLGFERSGEVPGPLQRDPTGDAEFIDARGQSWDVKAFNSNFPANKGGFDVARDARKVDNALESGENIMLDTQNLSRADRQALEREAAERGWGDRVKFW